MVGKIEEWKREGYYNATFYDGLSDDDYSISPIYDEYFPQLHRRSVFLTFYSFFEHLNQLCDFLEMRCDL